MSSAGREFKNWSPKDLEGSSQGRTPGRRGGGGDPSERRNAQGEDESSDLFLLSKEMEIVEEEAQKAGYEAGYAEGLAQARADMAPLREAWLNWASRVSVFEKERLKSVLPELAGLLAAALRRILGEESKKPESLRGLIERIVGEYAAGREAELRISEEDYRLVSQFDKKFIQDLATRGVRLEIGPDLESGQVELRFPDRIVSFDPGTAVDSLRRTLSRTSPAPWSEEPASGEEGKSP